MPRYSKQMLTGVRALRAANDVRADTAWDTEQDGLRRSGKATVAVVLKQWTTAAGETARVVWNMGARRARLDLEVGQDRKLGPRLAALHLDRHHDGEFHPTGGYVGIRKPQVDRDRFPLAAAFVDVWWSNPKETAGRLAMTAYEAATGETRSEQKASDHVKHELGDAGRFDIWKAAKNKSGRPCR